MILRVIYKYKTSFFFFPLWAILRSASEIFQATFSRTGRLQAQELGYIPEAVFSTVPADEKNQAGFVVSDDIEERVIGLKYNWTRAGI